MQNPEEIIKDYITNYIIKNDGENIDNEVIAYGFDCHMINTESYHIVLTGEVCFPILSIEESHDLPKEIHVKWHSEFLGEYSVHSQDGDELIEDTFFYFTIKL